MSFIKRWMRDDILTISPYAVQPTSISTIKLDAMESPFTLDKSIEKKLANKLQNLALNRYPSNQYKLKKVIKNLMNIDDNLEIMLGNGSDELIQLLLLACKTHDKILGFNPSFVMYEIISKWCSLKYYTINLIDDFQIDLNKTLKFIKQERPKIIFIAYPNNPTGNNFKRQDIEKILKITQNLVIIDEAYYAYSNDSFMSDILKYNNLIVLRTISKIGFAGLRLGIMIASKDMIAQFDKLRMPYNINSLTQIFAEFLLTQKKLIIDNAKLIKQQRQLVITALNAVKQITAYRSNANFILFKTKNANKLFDFLLKNNILIKNMNTTMQDFLRVTIGTKQENLQFLATLQKFYE